ncbi:phosphate signaling complex protein PhoU [Ammoniphilus sp. CFH 90114]|uniref:phosphate signaling complex protein PhoU n=1 Tax=Ammoniphilus sp. CFH 90114 TaxID=2493665 RepID=UPI00100EEAAF|nr:phosphate signaling complex protein PhoU [Ammoniphilus sp. CFH 90114]RXT04774.1 phosphate signaling complex protein PhoU [Ammoniphilus sp. CFH 90114]
MKRQSFDDHLEHLHRTLLSMATLVEENVFKSVKSLVDQNDVLAHHVIKQDEVINSLELEIEMGCFRTIALQQPVGSDLRKIGSMLKISADLERMGDYATSISKTAIRLRSEEYVKPLIDIPKMATYVSEMVRDALNAYVASDQEEALKIAKRDDVVDKYYSTIFDDLIMVMQQDSKNIHQGSHLLLVAQYLERIADHVTNICEWIVYMKTGEIKALNI